MSITNVAPGKKKKLSVLSQRKKKKHFVFFSPVTLKLRLGLNLTITMCLSEKQS